VKDGQQELESFLDRRATIFEKAMFNYISAKFLGNGDPAVRISELAELIRNTIILANLNGRKRTIMEADKMRAESVGSFAELPDRTPIAYGLTFHEAVDEIMEREPRVVPENQRSRAAAWIGELYSMEKAFAAARSVTEKLTTRVRDIIQDSITTGRGANKTEEQIMAAAAEEAQPWTRAYASTVYKTNAANSYNTGRFEQSKDPDVAKVIGALEVVGLADDRERDNHRLARGLIASQDDPVWESRSAKPPYGYNCFLPDTEIRGDIEVASKTRYSGEAVQIKTERGFSLSVTINHPILTSLGWKPANSLREGDDLFSYINEGESLLFNNGSIGSSPDIAGAIDHKHIPSICQDIFQSMFANGAIRSVWSDFLPLDFHGDAKWFNSYISIVASDGYLNGDATKSRRERFRDLVNVLSNGGSTLVFNSFCCSAHTTFLSDNTFTSNPRPPALPLNNSPIISSLSEGFPLSKFGLTTYSDTRIVPSKDSKDNAIVHIEFSTKFACTMPREISLDQLLLNISGGCVQKPNLHSFGGRSNCCSVASKEFNDSADANAKLVSEYWCGDPRFIQADKVRSVRRFPHNGHIYNLQSSNGLIIANNIVTSNCRHGLKFVSRFSLERMGLIKADGTVIRREPPGFERFKPDKGFGRGEF
jgi:SPP1 gp7 family putative phage head morphogenesis protein